MSGRQDLNLRPPAPKAGALPNCATPRKLHSAIFTSAVRCVRESTLQRGFHIHQIAPSPTTGKQVTRLYFRQIPTAHKTVRSGHPKQ